MFMALARHNLRARSAMFYSDSPTQIALLRSAKSCGLSAINMVLLRRKEGTYFARGSLVGHWDHLVFRVDGIASRKLKHIEHSIAAIKISPNDQNFSTHLLL